MGTIPLLAAERLRVTILVDNVTDPLLPDEGPIRRRTWPKALAPGQSRVPTRAVPGEGVPDALVAEPGFSALVEVEAAGRRRTLLFDTGVSPDGMVENARRLGLDLRDVEAIVLSHGHRDHVAGMDGVARVLGPSRLPVVIHPDGWTRRRLAFPGLTPAELPTPSHAALRGAGLEIVEERQPSLVLDGALLVTGEVDRCTAPAGGRVHALAGRFPDAFVQCAVGTAIELSA